MTQGVLTRICVPPEWKWTRLWVAASRVQETGQPDAEPLSVFLGAGVVPRASRSDNHNSLGEDLAKYQVVEPGDLVFNKLRTWQGGLGVSAHRGIVSPAYFVCRPTEAWDPRYMHYLLLSRPYLAELTRISKFMPPSQFDISWDVLRMLPVLRPPADEQRRIANFLEAESRRIDSLAAAQHKVRAVLLERRAANVFEATTGGAVPQRKQSMLPWVGSLPATWQSVKLGHFARMGSGHTPSRSRREWWENCTIPWVTTGEVSQVRDDRREVLTETRERVSEIGLANSAAEIHPKGTVVLCRTASAGYSAVIGEDMATSQDFVTWTCGPQLDSFYLLWCLRAMRRDLLGRLSMGSTHKTIYVPDLQMLRIPLPPLAEQRQIVESIRETNAAVDGVIDAIDRQLALLVDRRQALITAAVTGQIDVTTARGVDV